MSQFSLFLLGVGVCVTAVNWALVAVLIRYAPVIGLLDRPNERSSHTKVTPRGGGLVLVLVLALGLGASLLAGGAGELKNPLLVYLGSALFIAAISLRDDFKSLSPGIRLVCQLAVAWAAVAGIASFDSVTLPLIGSLSFAWAGGGLTVVWVIGLTNVYNFMDGIDGIAGVQGVTAGLAWTMAGVWCGAPAIVLLGILMTAGCLAFLFHNWSPARIFMGDVGSAFLGYSFAVLPLLLLRTQGRTGGSLDPGVIPVFALLAVWPFLGDGFYTFVRRARRGEAVWKPHRTHLYQRLVQRGWAHAQVSLLYAGWGGISAVAGLTWLRGPGVVAVGLAMLSLAALGGVYFLVARAEKADAVQR